MTRYDLVTGDGGVQNTVDFNLDSEEDKYTQTTSKTLDLSLLEALRASLSESVGISDSFRVEASYFRTVQESPVLNDSDIRDFSTEISEQGFVGDADSFKLERNLSEKTVLQDFYSRAVVFEQLYSERLSANAFTEIKAVSKLSEQLSVNDADVRDIEKPLVEGFSGDSTVDTEADLFRTVSEAFSLDETFGEAKIQFLDVSEVLAAQPSAEITTIINLGAESLTVSDNYSRSAQLFRDYNDSARVDDTYSLFLRDRLSENLSTDAFTEIKLVTDLIEPFAVGDNTSRSVGKLVAEDFSTNDSIRKKSILSVLSQGFFINDADIRNVSKPLQETVSSASAVERQADLFRSYSEQQSIDESFSKFVSTPVNEVLTVDDFRSSEIRRALTQSLELREVYIDTADLFRGYGEALGLKDVSDREQDLFRNYEADVALNEDEVLSVGKSVTQPLALDGVYSREADYFREQVERPRFKDTIERTFTRPVTESFAVDESIEFLKKISRTLEAVVHLEDSIGERRAFKQLEQSFSLDDQFDFFFSEGPGTPPYYVRNSIVQKNKVVNEFVSAFSLQNLFEELQVSNSFGDQEQT